MTFQQPPRLVPLPEREEWLDLNLTWSLQAWGERIPGYDRVGWSAFYRRALTADYEQYRPGAELVWVIEIDGHCVGSIALVGEDDLLDFTDCTPWLAAFVINPALRHQGIGSRVVEEFEAMVRRFGIVRLYLWTDTYGDWYRKLGYEEIGRSQLADITAVVMAKDL